MFEKTKNKIMSIARENNVVDSEVEEAISLLEDAFKTYAKAWRGCYTLRETKQQWEYFYNLLTNESLKQVKLDLTKYGHENKWTNDFLQILKIISGKTDTEGI